MLSGAVFGLAVLVACSLVALFHPSGGKFSFLRPARRTASWLACYARSIGFLPKLKILFSFYGIATVLDGVYNVKMPPAYANLVYSIFFWTQIDWVRGTALS